MSNASTLKVQELGAQIRVANAELTSLTQINGSHGSSDASTQTHVANSVAILASCDEMCSGLVEEMGSLHQLLGTQCNSAGHSSPAAPAALLPCYVLTIALLTFALFTFALLTLQR